MTSAIVSGITLYEYKWAVNRVAVANLFSTITTDWGDVHFLDKDAPLKLTDQENTTIAISSFVVIFSTIEIALAVCAAWISDSLFTPPQENQILIGQVREVIYLLETLRIQEKRCVLDDITPNSSITRCACVALIAVATVFSLNY